MTNTKKYEVKENDIKPGRTIYSVMFYNNGDCLIHKFKIVSNIYNVKFYDRNIKFFKVSYKAHSKGSTLIAEYSTDELGINNKQKNKCFLKRKSAEDYKKYILGLDYEM